MTSFYLLPNLLLFGENIQPSLLWEGTQQVNHCTTGNNRWLHALHTELHIAVCQCFTSSFPVQRIHHICCMHTCGLHPDTGVPPIEAYEKLLTDCWQEIVGYMHCTLCFTLHFCHCSTPSSPLKRIYLVVKAHRKWLMDWLLMHFRVLSNLTWATSRGFNGYVSAMKGIHR